MIVKLAINNVIYRMEGPNKMKTIGKKQHRRYTYTNINMGMVDMFKSRHIRMYKVLNMRPSPSILRKKEF